MDIGKETIAAQPTKLHALRLCITASGLEDKEIYSALGIDAGHWTRIKNGDAYFPNNKEHDLMTLCGNDIPLIWDAMKRGYELRPMRSDLERRVAELEHELSLERRDKEVILKFVREMRER